MITNKRYWTTMIASWIGAAIIVVVIAGQNGRMRYQLDASKEGVEQAMSAVQFALERAEANHPRLRYDSGGATIVLAVSPVKEETWTIHEFVASILREEDPNEYRWTVETVEPVDIMDPNCFDCAQLHAVIVPEINNPAFGSLCAVLNHRWGWREFYRQPLQPWPDDFYNAVHSPGQARLMCQAIYYMRLRVSEEQWYDRRWLEWESDMVEDPEEFEEFERHMDIDWTESPWFSRPHLLSKHSGLF